MKIKENEEKQYQKNKEKRKQIRDQKIKKLHLEAQKTGQRQILARSCNSSIAIANEYTTYTTTYVNSDGSVTVDNGKWNGNY